MQASLHTRVRGCRGVLALRALTPARVSKWPIPNKNPSWWIWADKKRKEKKVKKSDFHMHICMKYQHVLTFWYIMNGSFPFATQLKASASFSQRIFLLQTIELPSCTQKSLLKDNLSFILIDKEHSVYSIEESLSYTLVDWDKTLQPWPHIPTKPNCSVFIHT